MSDLKADMQIDALYAVSTNVYLFGGVQLCREADLARDGGNRGAERYH
jgi:hypothetical protein